MNPSDSFTLEQLTFSETAARKGLDNTPTPEQTANLAELAQVLERVQKILGGQIHINSAYRSPKVNAAVGGSLTSAHMEGYAADFTCKDFGTPLQVCQALAMSDLSYDQIIYEYESWCHLSIEPRMRKMVLTKKAGQPYVEGLT